MPAKVYVDAPPHGDFRAMPARGDGLAMLKWVTSFPRNPERGLPVVAGALLALRRGDRRAARDPRLRRGHLAAHRAPRRRSRRGRWRARRARRVGVIGCGVNGAWAARCLAAAGYGPGVCADPRAAAAEALAGELGWRAGTREEAAVADVVVTVTPAEPPVIVDTDLRPGQHLAVLGADAAGKAEVEPGALRRCRLFCDEWEQAANGGELSGAVAAGIVSRRR